MSRIKNPREKKRLSLVRDHRVFALEGNKTFRSAWRQKKAKANRKSRRADAMAAAGMVRNPLLGEAASSKLKPKQLPHKFGVMSLAQMIAFKEGALRHRWNYRKLGKNPDARQAAMRRSKSKGERPVGPSPVSD
ncbi:MAG TPA: hypothetical protein VKE26_15050 [Xanthobacteraceae bacterium]|nr:hypothetical protein [Xanthobacteraceae bacterium]